MSKETHRFEKRPTKETFDTGMQRGAHRLSAFCAHVYKCQKSPAFMKRD